MAEDRAPLGPKIRRPLKDHLDVVIREEMADQRGMVQWCVEAALLMFFEADSGSRMDYVRRLRDAELHGGTSQLIRDIREKAGGQPTARIAAKPLTGPKHNKPFKRDNDKKP